MINDAKPPPPPLLYPSDFRIERGTWVGRRRCDQCSKTVAETEPMFLGPAKLCRSCYETAVAGPRPAKLQCRRCHTVAKPAKFERLTEDGRRLCKLCAEECPIGGRTSGPRCPQCGKQDPVGRNRNHHTEIFCWFVLVPLFMIALHWLGTFRDPRREPLAESLLLLLSIALIFGGGAATYHFNGHPIRCICYDCNCRFDVHD